MKFESREILLQVCLYTINSYRFLMIIFGDQVTYQVSTILRLVHCRNNRFIFYSVFPTWVVAPGPFLDPFVILCSDNCLFWGLLLQAGIDPACTRYSWMDSTLSPDIEQFQHRSVSTRYSGVDSTLSPDNEQPQHKSPGWFLNVHWSLSFGIHCIPSYYTNTKKPTASFDAFYLNNDPSSFSIPCRVAKSANS